MALDSKQYMEELLEAAGISDADQRKALEAVFSNEKVATKLNGDFLRQQDYSRNMNEYKTEKERTSNYYQELVQWRAQQQALVDEALLRGQPVTQQQVQNAFDPEAFKKSFEADFQKKQQERDQQMIGLLGMVGRLASRHAVDFKEELDTDTIKDIAIKKGVSLDVAYNEWVAPRREERAKEQRAAEIKKAQEDAVREYASKHQIPVDNSSKEFHMLRDQPEKPKIEYTPNSGVLSPTAERSLKASFMEEWNKGAGGGTSG